MSPVTPVINCHIQLYHISLLCRRQKNFSSRKIYRVVQNKSIIFQRKCVFVIDLKTSDIKHFNYDASSKTANFHFLSKIHLKIYNESIYTFNRSTNRNNQIFSYKINSINYRFSILRKQLHFMFYRKSIIHIHQYSTFETMQQINLSYKINISNMIQHLLISSK